MTRLDARIRIEPDGTIVALSGKVEYGQGIRTGFAKIVADELRVTLERVRVILGETDVVPWDMGTFGSMSTATDGNLLRAFAAETRRRLVERASEALGVPATDLEARDGAIHARDGRSISYGELGPIGGDLPDTAREADRGHVPAVDAPLRLEAFDIVTGRGRYAADVRLPGLLRGRALRPPTYGARLKAAELDAAGKLPGVVAVVRDGDFVGVVAETTAQAFVAARAIVATWEPAPRDERTTDLSLVCDEGIDETFARAAARVRSRFEVPHVSNAPIGTAAAVADVREDEATIWVATQRPFALRDEAASLLDLPKERVHVHLTLASGTYGRNGGSDAAIDALRLSRAARRPVLVQWSRGDEFRAGPCRPEVDVDIEAAVDADGLLVGWRSQEWTHPHTYGGGELPPQVLILTSGRNAVPEYRAKKDVKLHIRKALVRTGAFRSLAAAPNVFAIESFVDELARRAEIDPIEYRLRLLDDSRLRRVLETVRDDSGWSTRRRSCDRGFGVACAIYHRSYVAEVVEVAIEPRGVRLVRAWCAVDPGRVIHPDGVRNQIEGAVQQATSWTLLEQLRHEDGVVTTSSWSDYPIATALDAPESIEVHLVPEESAPSTGIGEVGTVPLAAAVANAVFDACGARVRRLPITKDAIDAARDTRVPT